MVDEFKIFPDAEAVAQAAADFLSDQITSCVDAKAVCHVALPGGSTPARCLQLLSSKQLPWSSIHWYVGDERCYPRGHPERNDSMLAQQLWSRIETPAENLHPIPAELGPELAAEKYSGLIDGIGRLDIVVLGIGEDGRTRSEPYFCAGLIGIADGFKRLPRRTVDVFLVMDVSVALDGQLERLG